MTSLDENIAYVDANRDALLAKYLNKFILVVDRKVVKAFDAYVDAASYGVRNFGLDAGFLVRKMTKEPRTVIIPTVIAATRINSAPKGMRHEV